MREAVALIKVGFTEETAFNLSRDARVAMLVISGELDGNEFDWVNGRWKDKL